MWKDPIVDEVHRVRRKLAERFDHDLGALCADARERERQSGRTVVTRRPRSPRAIRQAKGRSRRDG